MESEALPQLQCTPKEGAAHNHPNATKEIVGDLTKAPELSSVAHACCYLALIGHAQNDDKT